MHHDEPSTGNPIAGVAAALPACVVWWGGAVGALRFGLGWALTWVLFLGPMAVAAVLVAEAALFGRRHPAGR